MIVEPAGECQEGGGEGGGGTVTRELWPGSPLSCSRKSQESGEDRTARAIPDSRQQAWRNSIRFKLRSLEKHLMSLIRFESAASVVSRQSFY